MTEAATTRDQALAALYHDVEARHLAPLWPSTAQLLPAEPETKDDEVLFSVQDTAVMQALGLSREQAFEPNHGQQNVSEFSLNRRNTVVKSNH